MSVSSLICNVVEIVIREIVHLVTTAELRNLDNEVGQQQGHSQQDGNKSKLQYERLLVVCHGRCHSWLSERFPVQTGTGLSWEAMM